MIDCHHFVLLLRFDSRHVKKDLTDYKFFCFNGEPKLCQVISNRSTNETIDFYDMDWNRQIGLVGLNDGVHNSKVEQKCPNSYEKMKLFAQVISKGKKFSRIDFYDINGNCYFGEITFYPNSGYGSFRPHEWNNIIGGWIDLNLL